MNVRQPVVLVTGTSSGIGLELAKLLWDRHEYRVVITSRQKSMPLLRDKLFFDTERFWIRPLDVTSRQSISDTLYEIEQHWGGVDILINNAAISYRSVVEDMTYIDEDTQMKTNYAGPLNLIRDCLNHMRKQKWGRIINISSVGGMMAMPTMASYSASKFALEGATEALWYEMKPWNVKVSLIQPGFINSESFRRVFYTDKFHQEDLSYLPYYQNMNRLIEKMMKRSRSSSKDIALLILKVMKQKNPKLRIRATPDAHLFAIIRRFLPRTIYHNLMYYSLPNVFEWNKNPPYSKKVTGMLNTGVLPPGSQKVTRIMDTNVLEE